MDLTRRALVAVTCLGLALALLAPASSAAAPEPLSAPQPRSAQQPASVFASWPLIGHFPIEGETTVAPGGAGAVNSPALPSTAKSTTVTVTKATSGDSLVDAFAVGLSSITEPLGGSVGGARLLLCASLMDPVTRLADTEPEAAFVFLVLAKACFRALIQVLHPRTTRTSGCGPMTYVKVPVTLTQTSAGYSVNFTGAVRNARPKFTARCTINGDRMTLRLKAKKGKTLARTVGPTINVGIAAPLTNTAAAPMTVRFGNPR